MKEADRAADYAERDVRAVYAVLIELGQVLGAFRDKFVVVGGAVPWLLLGDAVPQHIGTLDIDLDLDPEALSSGEYASLIEALENHGYERAMEELKDFQLRRQVKVDDGPSVAVLVDLLMPREARLKKKRPRLVEDFRVQGVDGGEVALAHHVTHKFSGKMPDGRSNTVDLLVATIPALLAMKGYALVGRDKKKDAYDIYFSVRNFPGGTNALAAECRPLLAETVARKGFEHIAEKFSSRDSFGPETVRLFLEESRYLGEMTSEQTQTDAFQQINAFLRALGTV